MDGKLFPPGLWGDTLENLSRTGEVEMNLVVSSVGLPAAKILREKFGTPYVIGTPISGFTEELIQIMNKKIPHETEGRNEEKDNDSTAYLANRLSGVPEITLIGEAVTMGSLAAFIEKNIKNQSVLSVLWKLTRIFWRQMTVQQMAKKRWKSC